MRFAQALLSITEQPFSPEVAGSPDIRLNATTIPPTKANRRLATPLVKLPYCRTPTHRAALGGHVVQRHVARVGGAAHAERGQVHCVGQLNAHLGVYEIRQTMEMNYS